MNNLSPKWKELKVEATKLCDGDTTRKIYFSVYDWDKVPSCFLPPPHLPRSHACTISPRDTSRTPRVHTLHTRAGGRTGRTT